MENKIKEFLANLGKVIGIVFMYFFLQIIFGAFFNDILNSKNPFISNCTLLLVYALLVLIIGLFFLPKLINDIAYFKKENIKIAFKNWGLGFLFMFVSNLYLTYFVGNIASNEASNRALLTASPEFAIILMVILAPALEEIVFRLNLKRAFNNKYVFCIISGLLFGGMHLIGASGKELLYIIPYGLLGFFFAKAYFETDNIYTSILAHMFHNGLSVYIILLGMALI